jgi:hypothetical protein
MFARKTLQLLRPVVAIWQLPGCVIFQRRREK